MTAARHEVPRPPPRRRIRTAVLFGGALLFLFEEWLWVVFTRLFAWLGRFGLLRWLDARLVRLAPLAALVILCVPVVLLFPIKVVGLWMIASGKFLSGCAVMLAAKVTCTAIVARIFLTTRAQLLRMPWFARLYNVTCALRLRVHQWLAEQPAWHDARKFVAGIRRLFKGGRRYRQAEDRDGRGAPAGVLWRWRRTRRTALAASLARSSRSDAKRR